MNTQIKPSFLTLLLLISFGSVNAVLFTPALPQIAEYFAVSNSVAQHTITWFLIGYALGQLIYSPIANRYGRKPALYTGIGLQIISSFICIFAGTIHSFDLLLLGRFLLALGSGVGLKMTFTLINECYEPQAANAILSYVMLSFAVTPGLGVALGGFLTEHFGWRSCFYAGEIYGFILLILVMRLPETLQNVHHEAFKLKNLVTGYSHQFKNVNVLSGGLLMGFATCFIYIFAAVAPFIAINLFNMSSAKYGMANILPPIGLFLGSIISPWYTKKYSFKSAIRLGVITAVSGCVLMLVAIIFNLPVIIALFLPMIIIYFGQCFIFANVSSIVMSKATDKAHGSAVMSFLNMATATFAVLSVGLFPIKLLAVPIIFLILCAIMLVLYQTWVKEVSVQ